MAVVLKKAIATVIVLALAAWVVRYGLLWHAVENPARTVARPAAPPVAYFPQAWYDHGMQAWYAGRTDAAVAAFRRAVAVDVLHADAWIRLARAEAVRGNPAAAAEILTFTDALTSRVVKWKWPQLILARDLGREDIFFDNINFVVPYAPLRSDALQLLDRHLGSDTARVLEVLAPRNLPDYLRWLMRWQRTEDSLRVWSALEGGHAPPDDDLRERYVRFLIAQKEYRRAAEIRERHTGGAGLSNPGFDAPLAGGGFGWQAYTGQGWEVRRVRPGAAGAGHALEVTFSGQANVNAPLVSQVVPVAPGRTGTLSFQWQSRGLTTDQRPLVEIRALEGAGGPWRSAMAPQDTGWREETIAFEIPPDCHAVRVTLRRQRSLRFDNQIKGVLRLDEFRLDSAPPPRP